MPPSLILPAPRDLHLPWRGRVAAAHAPPSPAHLQSRAETALHGAAAPPPGRGSPERVPKEGPPETGLGLFRGGIVP